MIDKQITISLKKYGFDQNMLVKITKNKNSYLKIDRNNNIVFLKSIFMSQFQAEKFIQKHIASFIEKTRIQKENIPYNLEQNWVVLFGKFYNLFYLGKGKGFSIDDKTISIKGKDIESAFNNFRKKQEVKIIDIAQNIAQAVCINTIFKVKSLKAVWGNCTPEKNIISLNTRLIFFRTQVIEYVIYHELAHFTYPHHQKDFWSLVESWCPNYKLLKKELRNW